jgi:GDP-4-dehydro-6-deoxy-D-mannose reductase
MRLLVTGISGFVGSHMADHALAEGATVFGSRRKGSNTANIEHLKGRLTLVEADLSDPRAAGDLVEAVDPSHVIHLAGQSFAGTSWNQPAEVLSNNILSQVNLLEAIRHRGVGSRIVVAGSAEEYGMVSEDELPITETNALRPLSPYAVSKVTQDLMGYQYFKSFGLAIIRTRAFNHEGPRRGELFVPSNFAKQMAEIEAGLRPPVVHVGDLKPRRDYSDVRDVARGYWLLLMHGEPGEVYNLSSGRAWAIRELLDFLLTQCTVKGIEVRTDPARLRPSEVSVAVGDPSKIEKATGWRAEIPMERTLTDLLDYWRARVRRSSVG